MKKIPEEAKYGFIKYGVTFNAAKDLAKEEYGKNKDKAEDCFDDIKERKKWYDWLVLAITFIPGIIIGGIIWLKEKLTKTNT